ncbi:MAG TPA: hypothetical protein PKC20_12195 [Burkholderiaceae bacterium]|nr:hypothetical protein [Burkholderiaceae bacterium]
MLTRPASADSTLPPIPRALLVAALAFGFCLLARLVSHGDAVRLLFWPATGVAFAFGWRHGLAWTAPAAIGAFAYGALAYRDAGLAAAAAAATAVGAALPIVVLRRLGDWKPAEWAPWSLLSTGAIVILYSVTLNRGG